MRGSCGSPRDGDQLELGLFTGVPWLGRDPRALTSIRTALFLKRELPGAMRSMKDPEQLELWPVEGPPRVRASGHRSGAPLLVDPSYRRKRRFLEVREGCDGS